MSAWRAWPPVAAPLAVSAMMTLAMAGSSAVAHPHVWATVETEVLYGPEQRVTGFRHAWTFDEYYSAFASQGLDGNGDGKLSREELAPLADENVKSLSEFDYFTFVKVDDQDAELLDPVDYWLESKNGLLTLHFTLPLKEPVDARLGAVSFSVYDPSYFVAFDFAKTDPVRLARAAPKECRASLGREKADAKAPARDEKRLSEAFFEALGPGSDFGARFAQSASIECKRR